MLGTEPTFRLYVGPRYGHTARLTNVICRVKLLVFFCLMFASDPPVFVAPLPVGGPRQNHNFILALECLSIFFEIVVHI